MNARNIEGTQGIPPILHIKLDSQYSPSKNERFLKKTLSKQETDTNANDL